MIKHGINLLDKVDKDVVKPDSKVVTTYADIEHLEKTGELITYKTKEELELAKKSRQDAERLLPRIDNHESSSEMQKGTSERLIESFVDDSTDKQEACTPDIREVKEVTRKPLINKPTKEELATDQLTLTKNQTMEKYGVSKATLERWKVEYKLPNWIQNKLVTGEQKSTPEPLNETPAVDCAKVDEQEDCGGNMDEQKDNDMGCFGAYDSMIYPPTPCLSINECRIASKIGAKLETMPDIEDDVNLGEIPFGEVETPWCLGNPEVFLVCHKSCSKISDCVKAVMGIKDKTISSSMYSSAELDEFDWGNIKESIGKIRQRKIMQVEKEIQNKLSEMLHG